MDFATVGFWVLSALLIGMSLVMVLESKRLVHYVLFLFVFLLLVAAMLILLNAVFLSIAELIVYNGGIVLLLAIGISFMPEGTVNKSDAKYLAVIPALVLVLITVILYGASNGGVNTSLDYGSLGVYLFTNYAVLLGLLGVTSVATLISALYFISEEDVTT
jgi:NADH-quinone oxidoreductase subunit J